VASTQTDLPDATRDGVAHILSEPCWLVTYDSHNATPADRLQFVRQVLGRISVKRQSKFAYGSHFGRFETVIPVAPRKNQVYVLDHEFDRLREALAALSYTIINTRQVPHPQVSIADFNSALTSLMIRQERAPYGCAQAHPLPNDMISITGLIEVASKTTQQALQRGPFLLCQVIRRVLTQGDSKANPPRTIFTQFAVQPDILRSTVVVSVGTRLPDLYAYDIQRTCHGLVQVRNATHEVIQRFAS